eukprot:TRINITY_DN9622_c0_g1_i1.p1 TRINITY_DN9622_c0_g1~~TRINITY_DN9622_c0_g1_i1.p1  ORF type:complete len:284 (+),score=52.14 TRINITY_DN9622_c0_g1_i1:93-944(+)
MSHQHQTVQEFSGTIQELEAFVPVLLQMADTEAPEDWYFVKNSMNVDVYDLAIAPGQKYEDLAPKLPHMVKGVGMFPMTLSSAYDFMVNVWDFELKRKLDPLLQTWEVIDHAPENGSHQLYLYRAVFRPPAFFMSARHFAFVGQTYLYDGEGKEIPLPKDEKLDSFIAANKHIVRRVVMCNRSVTEEEIEASSKCDRFTIDERKALRGNINLIAWVLDFVDDNQCRAQILCDMHVGGYIPEFVKTIIAHHNASGFMKIKQHVETDYLKSESYSNRSIAVRGGR